MFIRKKGPVNLREQGARSPRPLPGPRKHWFDLGNVATAVIPSSFGVSAECGHVFDLVVWIPTSRELFQINVF